jgi:hypothetical protein
MQQIMFIHTKKLYLRIAPFSEGTQNTRVDITILWYTSSFSKICYLSCKQGFRDWLSPQGWNVSHGLLYLFSISLGLSPNFSLKASCRCTHIMCPCRPSQKTHLQIFDLISESTKPIDHIIFINLQDTSKQLLQSKQKTTSGLQNFTRFCTAILSPFCHLRARTSKTKPIESYKNAAITRDGNTHLKRSSPSDQKCSKYCPFVHRLWQNRKLFLVSWAPSSNTPQRSLRMCTTLGLGLGF